MIPPSKHAETGPFKAFWKALNDLRDFAISTRPRKGRGVKLRETSDGTVINADDQAGTAPAVSGLTWRGEWNPAVTDYVEDDLVIRGSANTDSAAWNDTDAILNDGTKGGLYRAKRAVPVAMQPREPADDSDNWETFARGSWHIFKVATKAATNGTVLLKSGISNVNAQMKAAGAGGTVDIQTVQCNGKMLFVREFPVCENGVLRKAMFVMSVPYD